MLNKLKARGQRHRVDRTFGQKLELGARYTLNGQNKESPAKQGKTPP